MGTNNFFDAAAKGNVVALRLLHSCDVVDLECSDYDHRNALHIAAAEGRLLAVSYLMSSSFSPHFLDRWGATAMDDALKGETMYHMYCAKLIQSMGGSPSLLKDTEEGARALDMLEQLPIDEVRNRLRNLNRAGYNQIVPKQVVAEEVAMSFERCLAHLPLVQTMIENVQEPARACSSATALLHELAVKLDTYVRPICKLLDLYPFLRQRKNTSLLELSGENFQAARGTSLESELTALEKCEASLSRFDEHTGSRHFLVKKLSNIIRLALEDGNIDTDEQIQIDLAWEELTSVGENQLLYGLDVLDSDEEEELFADVDNLMSEREFCEAHGIERNLYRLHRFQTSTLRITDMEGMYARLCSIFTFCHTESGDDNMIPSVKADDGGKSLQFAVATDNDPYIGITELVKFFDMIGDETMRHTPRFEIEVMLEEAFRYQQKNSTLLEDTAKHASLQRSDHDGEQRVSLKKLVAGSQSFRSAMQGLKVEEAFGIIMQKSKLSAIVTEPLLREICKSGTVRLSGKGELLFDSEQRTDPKVWFVVISGSLFLTKAALSGNEDSDYRSLGNGSMFGGAACLNASICPCAIRCASGCSIVELPLRRLKSLQERYPEMAKRLADEMAESKNQEDLHGPAEKMAASEEASLVAPGGLSEHNLLAHNTEKQEDANVPQAVLSAPPTKPEKMTVTADLVSPGEEEAGASKDEGSTSKPAITMLDLYIINSGFKCIAEVWRALSGGGDLIPAHVLHSLQDELGEVGSGVFRKLFLFEPTHGSYGEVCELAAFHDFDAGEFWARWIQLMLDKRPDDEGHAVSGILQDNSKGLVADISKNDLQDERSLSRTLSIPNLFYIPSSYLNSINWISMAVQSFYAASKFSLRQALRKKYFERGLIESGRYERAYVLAVKTLNDPLEEGDIPVFIQYLFPEESIKVTARHCVEFKEIFGRNGSFSAKISWMDIMKVLRPILSLEDQTLLVGATFHPHSRYMTWFGFFLKFVAVYHFISIPLLLCFVDDSVSMTDPLILYVFIPSDVLTFICVLVELNTAFKNVRTNKWVTNHLEIAKRLGNMGIVPGVPFDWIAYAVGNRYETCLWIRMTKLCMVFRIFGLEELGYSQLSAVKRALYQILASMAVLHIFSCLHYFIAKKYPQADPENPYVWYKVKYPENSPLFRPNLPTDSNGFEYSGLSCNETQTAQCQPGDTWYYFGMNLNDGLMAKYMVSFYLTCCIIADQNLYGNIVPQNFVEVGFGIIMIILNLTLFRWVIGDLSMMVMESDEGKFAARTRSLKIFSFISKNSFAPELANEIRSYCENANEHLSGARCAKVLRFLPRFLQDEVARHVCRDLLDRMEMLTGCSNRFKDHLSSAVTTKAFSPEEYLFRIGEVANELYIVQTGTVDTLIEASNTLTGEKIEASFGQGAAVEQVAFFFQLRFVVSARASRQGAVCLRVGRDSFLQILKCFPVDEELVSHNALKTISFTKTGTSTVSFLSEREGEKTILTTKSHLSDVSAGRHGKKNRNSIVQIEANRTKMKLLVMFSAVKEGDLATVQWCLKGGMVTVNDCDDYGRSLLHISACTGNADITLFLLKNSADVNAKDQRGNTPLNEAVLGCHDHIAAIIREQVPGTCLSFDGFQSGTKLCQAAFEGNLAQVRISVFHIETGRFVKNIQQLAFA